MKNYENKDNKKINEKEFRKMFFKKEYRMQIEEIDDVFIIGFISDIRPNSQIIREGLKVMNEINNKIKYTIVNGNNNELLKSIVLESDELLEPVIVCYNAKKEKTGVLEQYPVCFKNRIKRLDDEDKEELYMRYNNGNYSNDIVGGLIAFMKQ
ncbi:MAG: hypothetical protein ACRCSG_06135 [Cellulosilyticaceae bacterium]